LDFPRLFYSPILHEEALQSAATTVVFVIFVETAIVIIPQDRQIGEAENEFGALNAAGLCYHQNFPLRDGHRAE
jgi:hypothetical protein